MTDLIHQEHLDVGRPARDSFADDQVALIKRTIAPPDATDAEVDLFLEVAARYKLNPLTGEVYLAKMPGANGGGGRFTIIVSRAGFLAIAQRDAAFEGIDSDVVRAYDEFAVEHTKDGVVVNHRYDLGVDDFAGGLQGDPAADAEPREAPKAGSENAEQRVTRKRGKIIGAWAIIHRGGRRPTFIFVPWSEYVPKGDRLPRSWKLYPSAMIRKVAVSNALREAYSLSGLYSDAEMDALIDAPVEQDAAEEPEWGEGRAADYLRALVDTINEIKPGSWRPAKVRMTLAGASDKERAAFVEELERKIKLAGGTLPDLGDVDAEAEEVAVEEEPVA